MAQDQDNNSAGSHQNRASQSERLVKILLSVNDVA